MRKYTILAATTAAVALLVPACNLFLNVAFDATGLYEGAWRVNLGQQQGETDDCPFTLVLEQDTSAGFPDKFSISGEAILDFACFTFGQSIIPARTLPVSGIMEPSGRIFLSSPDLISNCPEGETCVRIALEATGIDDDDDGKMDRASGSWILTIQSGGGTPIPFPGTFEAEIVLE